MPVTVAARVLPPIVKATEAPASFVPVMVVVCSLALMMSSVATALMMGAVGAAVSTVMARVPAALVLPAASVCVTDRVLAPWPMAVMSAATKV